MFFRVYLVHIRTTNSRTLHTVILMYDDDDDDDVAECVSNMCISIYSLILFALASSLILYFDTFR